MRALNREHRKLFITDEQRANLITLKTYLSSGELKAEFDMGDYCPISVGYYATECGSVGCAVGQGPYAGIPKLDTETWGEYANRVFGADEHGRPFTFMFGYGWFIYDNAPEGAAERIDYALEYGIPMPKNEMEEIAHTGYIKRINQELRDNE